MGQFLTRRVANYLRRKGEQVAVTLTQRRHATIDTFELHGSKKNQLWVNIGCHGVPFYQWEGDFDSWASRRDEEVHVFAKEMQKYLNLSCFSRVDICTDGKNVRYVAGVYVFDPKEETEL